jgi:uncharacterized protein with HEPN domain
MQSRPSRRQSGASPTIAEFPTEPWQQIKSIGNRMRHEYFRLDDAILWEIIATDTHSLKTVMEAMLARHAGESGG